MSLSFHQEAISFQKFTKNRWALAMTFMTSRENKGQNKGWVLKYRKSGSWVYYF